MHGIFEMDGTESNASGTTGYVDGSAEPPGILNVSLEATSADTQSKDGEQAGHETPVSSEAAGGRIRGDLELKCNNGQIKTCMSPAEEPPRRNFHIPRKNKEKKALFQYLAPESREFKDIVEVLSTSYLQSSSTGTFVYAKAQLVHSEPLEKDFVEKRRELKLNGRTDNELSESYSFLLSDCYKLRDVCEKGLLVGHSRLTALGDPAKGVYLSRYSDLLQTNTFADCATGEIIIFKVLKGKVKTVNMSKNMWDPTPNFECHVGKTSYKVTSCLAYRAFEFTQQYFYEYAFDELRNRPRHVCPYAVVSFMYQEKASLPVAMPMAPLRSISRNSEGSKEPSSYTLWSGQLQIQGGDVYQAVIRSSTHGFLPLKLPETLDIGMAMKMDEMKKKIPAALLSWQTYRETGEASEDGLHCSLFVVEDGSKQRSGFSSLLTMLEKGKMVLVKPLIDKGFLILLSSAQTACAQDVGRGWTLCLQALFVFQEARGLKRPASKETAALDAGKSESKSPFSPRVKASFLPALHYALWNLRSKPVTHLASEVERQARCYLVRQLKCKHQSYCLGSYKQSCDEQKNVRSVSKLKHGADGYLRSYFYCPKLYQLPLPAAEEMLEALWCSVGHSPASHCEGSNSKLSAPGDRERARVTQAENDPDKIEELLNLIHMQKKNLVEEDAESRSAGAGGVRKRKAQSDALGLARKYLQLDENKTSPGDEECDLPDSLSLALNGTALSDTDLRQWQVQADAASGTQTLLEMLLGTLKQALGHVHETERPGSCSEVKESREEVQPSEEEVYSSMKELGLPASCDIDLRKQAAALHPAAAQRPQDPEEETCESLSSIDEFSPCSSSELQPGPNLTHDALVPWRLIPLTGITPCKYSARKEDDDPFDPRFGGVSVSCADVAPTAGHAAAAPAGGCVSVAMDRPPVTNGRGGGENFSPNKEPKLADVLNKTPSENTAKGEVGGAAGQDLCWLDAVLGDELGCFYTDVQEVLRGERVYRSCEFSRRPPRPCQSGAVFSEYVRHHTEPAPVHGYVSLLRDGMRRVISGTSALEDDAPVPSPPRSPGCDSAPHAHDPPLQVCRPAQSISLPDLDTNVQLACQGAPDDHGADPQRLAADRGPSPALLEPVTPGPALNSVISQIEPEVFSSLMEIIKGMQKNKVKFYIHCTEESAVCTKIKNYLIRLGNAECKPDTFLKSNDAQDKLLIVIQNKDIAAHIHTIPGLLSLKKLPSVSFAGVDSLEDVTNRTYNELFVSGGFVVSDEFVLHPDFVTHGQLQLFLKFLEEKCSTDTLWRLKVHCKTQKKLKELGRLNSRATDLLNLLFAYQRRHVVEFLPYHDCDSGSRHAPDLNCLIRLQAQHTVYRHIIFLTERRFEMFPYHSANGVIIASISDIMDGLPYLTGSSACGIVPPTDRSTEEDMSLDSEEDVWSADRPAVQLTGDAADFLPHPPDTERFRPPLPEQEPSDAAPASCGSPEPLLRLKEAIDQFKTSHFPERLIQSLDNGQDSPFDNNFNPYQTFLSSDSAWPVHLPSTTGPSLARASLSPSLSFHHAMAGSCSSSSTALSSSSSPCIVGAREGRERAGWASRDDVHSVPKCDAAVPPAGHSCQEAAQLSVTSYTVSVDCSSDNLGICNWGPQQGNEARQQINWL